MATAASSCLTLKYSGYGSPAALRRASSSQTGGHSEPGEQKRVSIPCPFRISMKTAAPFIVRCLTAALIAEIQRSMDVKLRPQYEVLNRHSENAAADAHAGAVRK